MLQSVLRVKHSSSKPKQLILQSLIQKRTQATYHDQTPYWQKIGPWKDVSTEEFLSWRWQSRNAVSTKHHLYRFLSQALPEKLGTTTDSPEGKIRTKDEFIEDALTAFKLAPMAVRLTPHVLANIDWNNPVDDPVRRQFIPLRSGILPDNEHLELDSLHEKEDSPVPGLVHRYPGRALFLATSICPVYCRYCTRSYAVGADTETVSKEPQKPSRRRWEVVLDYIEKTEELQDIVVSGGDAFYLTPEQIWFIGKRLLDMPHMRRIRFASKGLGVAPERFLDESDAWTDVLIKLSNLGRKMGKQVCLHTHINSVNEITWITKMAANKLFEHGVIVRNQAVLLKNVNNSEKQLLDLIKALADINVQPYYIYQCDMVRGVEDLRTPLSDIIELDKKLRGQLSGFMMPSFVIDLPGGGGKRLVSTAESYKDGIATYRSPGLNGEKGTREYYYHDPKPVHKKVLEAFKVHQLQALDQGKTLEEFSFNAPKLPVREAPLPPPSCVPQIPHWEQPHYEQSSAAASTAA